MAKNITLGFAGPGKIEPTNVKDLLGDYLLFGPEDAKGIPAWPTDTDDIELIIPCTDDQLSPMVETIAEWSEYADITYTAVTDGSITSDPILTDAENVIETKNVNLAMIEYLVSARAKGDDVALIVSWGESGDDLTEVLFDLATAHKITTLALDQGLDVLQFSDQPEPEPEPERPRRGRRREAAQEEAAAEPDRPRRGRARKAADQPAEAPEKAQDASLETQVAQASRRAGTTAEGTDVVWQALTAARSLVDGLDTVAAARSLDDGVFEPSPLGSLLRQALEALKPPQEAPAKKKGGRPRRDGTPAQPRTPGERAVKQVFDPGTGTWEPAGRGRIPKDAKVRSVDPKTGEVLDD